MPCSRAQRACRIRLGGCSRRSPRLPPQAEVRLLEAIAGDVVGNLEECLASGMLEPGSDGVAFRHELARLTIQESLAPDRRVALDRAALEALADPRVGRARPRQAGAPCGRRGRCGGGTAVRAGRRRPRGRAGCPPRSSCSLRSRSAIRTHAAVRGARGAAGALLPRVLPHQPGRRGDRRAPTRDRAAPRAGRHARGGRRALLAVADPVVPGPRSRSPSARARRPSRCSSGCPPGASSRWPAPNLSQVYMNAEDAEPRDRGASGR